MMRNDATALSLAGTWGFRLDPERRGVAERWFGGALPDAIALPGSTDDAGYGRENDAREVTYLTRTHVFEGQAWYQKRIEIPQQWAGKSVLLFLERCLWETELWVDDDRVGYCDSLLTPHVYDLTRWARPGAHRLTLLVDSTPRGTPKRFRNHAYTEHTQTVWNGVIGRIELSCRDPVHLADVQVYPNVAERSIRVVSKIGNDAGGTVEGTLSCSVRPNGSPTAAPVTARQSFAAGGIHHPAVVTELSLGSDALLWDEFSPNLYQLEVTLESTAPVASRDRRQVTFGLREMGTRGTQFLLNGRVVFLRGTHDAGNAPVTGYPDMDVESWRRIYRIGKSYGLNHWRFHSWTPPEAAFTAADEEGILLQPEMVEFSEIGRTYPPRTAFDDAWRKQELARILACYGNHPSFCLMTMGNEQSDDPVGHRLISEARQADPRRLYSTVSNDFVVKRPYDGDQFWVTPFGRDFAENRGKSFFFTERPRTDGDYRDLFAPYEVPAVTHELGQWWVYPNFAELPKYRGNLRARSFELFRESLERRGMLDLAPTFVQASGALSALLYREEIERALRTPGYGGFQLLDIHDYPGQGSATVGMLDSFWDSKGIIAPEAWRRFCQPVVLLARLPRYVWTSAESFTADLEVANYGPGPIAGATTGWKIRDAAGKALAAGDLPPADADQGALTQLGQITASLASVAAPQKLSFEVALRDTAVANDWPLWVFPETIEMPQPDRLVVARKWTESLRRELVDGATVVLFARRLLNAEPIRFANVFWSPFWVSNQPMSSGLVIDTGHPSLAHFPTDTHSNWHWWELLSIVEEVEYTEEELFRGNGVLSPARAVVLNDLPAELVPIIQVIDQPLRNNREAVLFEAAVGRGRLLVCTLDVDSHLERRIVARQLRYSLLSYAASERFRPAVEVRPEVLEFILSPR
jgi:hypothetical protein